MLTGPLSLQFDIIPEGFLIFHFSLGGAISVDSFSGAALTALECFLLLRVSLGGAVSLALLTVVLKGAVSVVCFSGAASTAPEGFLL